MSVFRSAALARLIAGGLFSMGLPAASAETGEGVHAWEVHDPSRPLPPRVDAGPGPSEPAPIPSDAIVLFDGTDADADLSAWSSAKDPWPVHDGYFECPPEGGNWLATDEKFGDIQLHAEWYVPQSEASDRSQGRGNSGIYLMGKYEVQVLETREN
ncbi:MAG: DUF1080 domain-containing protein, partial [Planctomycetota bacterium]